MIKARMMRKLLFLLLIFSHSATAQWRIGGKAGMSFSNIKTKINWKEASNTGIAASLMAYKQIRPNTGITIQIEYLQKGYYHKICNTIYDKLVANYLELPVTVDYNFDIPSLKNFRAHFGLGIYAAYWLSGKYKTKGFDSTEDKFDFDAQNYNRFDVGPAVMTRIAYLLNNGSLSLDVRYEVGLMDMQTKINDDTRNTNRSFVLGLCYLRYLQRN
jgi:hypothetical protein